MEGAAPAGVVLFGSRPQNAGKGVELGGKPSSSTASAATVFGIAAGGSISQQINKDTQDISVYDFDAGRRIYIHLINACAWKYVELHSSGAVLF